MSCCPEAKRKMLQIATHSGTFHADDALAVSMLRILPEYKNSSLVRTRQQEVLDSADIRVDVGGVYDPEKHSYDHHQAGFDHTMNSLNADKPWTVKLSSAGLVFNHFGRRIIRQLAKNFESTVDLDDKTVEKLFDKVYENFVMEIDAIDNGINQYKQNTPPKYRIRTCLSSRVDGLNPTWREERNDQSLLERFERAVTLTGGEFEQQIRYYFECWLPARLVVAKAVEKRFETDQSGEIIEFTDELPPWQKDFFELEKELGIEGQIKYCIFHDDVDQTYRIRAIPIHADSFTLRFPLPAEWRGLRGEALSKVCGLSDAVFVHMTGFIGGAKSRESVFEMARTSSKKAKEEEKKEENRLT